MDISPYSLFLLPVGLGLLGFIEPCTVGAHLLFLRSLGERKSGEKIGAALIFVAVRALTVGFIGAFAAVLGQRLIAAQTTVWLVFGILYTFIGLAYLFGRAGLIKKQIDLAPSSWKRADNPALLGIVFGFNIPACAAPIVFGLFGLAASVGSIATGFAVMAVFGLSLSVPLVLFAVQPKLSVLAEKMAKGGSRVRWVLGTAFVAVGFWSIWFGLFVDPADWAAL